MRGIHVQRMWHVTTVLFQPAARSPLPGHRTCTLSTTTHAASSSHQGDGGNEREEPIWFIQEFEKRHKELEEADRRRQEHASGGATVSSAGGSRPVREQKTTDADAAAVGDVATPTVQRPAEWSRMAVRQSIQLALGLAALILLPAALYPGGLAVARVWLLYAIYIALFWGGTVRRILLHGPLAKADQDAQRRSPASLAALCAFVAAMPVLHWLPLLRYLARLAATPLDRLATASGGPCAYDAAGLCLMAAAAALNWSAAAALGAAYDRVVAPKALVTAGPYSLVQHPIYGSYMLLFSGYCMACHSAPFAILAVWVCALYYRRRAALESQVLRESFGDEYEDYVKRTPRRFVPWIA